MIMKFGGLTCSDVIFVFLFNFPVVYLSACCYFYLVLMDIIYPISELDKVHEQDLGRDKANHDLVRDECETNHNKLSNDSNEDEVFQQQSSFFTDSATDNTVRSVQMSFCG